MFGHYSLLSFWNENKWKELDIKVSSFKPIRSPTKPQPKGKNNQDTNQ